MSSKLMFKVRFRPLGDPLQQPFCDSCEGEPSAWYNELLAHGLCQDCMDEMQEDYKKNGGD